MSKPLRPDIAERAVEEVMRVFITPGNAHKRTGIATKQIRMWKNDKICPTADSLEKLYSAGADVLYILSGVRAPKRYR